jgi:hypothetical protein
VQQREQEKADRDYSEDSGEELDRMRELAGVQNEGDIDINDAPQSKDYGPGPSPELEGEVEELLKRFERNATEMGAYGQVDFEAVVSMIAQGDPGGAADEVYGSFTDKDGGEPRRLEPMIDDLQAEFEELANSFGESSSPELEDIRRLSGIAQGLGY